MEKVTINNQVVLMRKFVKQAKIRAINNYTKEIRKLQNRKGSDEATSKFKRKAERLLEKVAILRKIQPDTVSRKALAKEKDWNVVLKEKNVPLEDQCYALLANYAAVQSEVERFHKKYWDLVPKVSTFFKDWEEKSKDPISKQEKKKAKQLRKSMKNVKFDKNNPNAIPIDKNANTVKDQSSPNKNASTKSMVAGNTQRENELNKKHLNTKISTFVENKATMKTNSDNEIRKYNRNLPMKKSQTKLGDKQIKSAEAVFNKDTELSSGEEDNDKKETSEDEDGLDKYCPISKNGNFGEIDSDEEKQNSDEEGDSEKEIHSCGDNSQKDISDEEEMNSNAEDSFDGEEDSDEDNSQKDNSDEEGNSGEEFFVKGPLKFQPNRRIATQNKDPERGSDDNIDSYSENSDFEGNEASSESDNDLKSFVDATKSETSKKSKVPKSKPNTNKPANKPQDIQSRLQAIAENKLKSDIKRKRQKSKINSNKPAAENKCKAVAMLNLNEMLGLDEIPIQRTDDIVEETGETKRKKDPFFLGKGGEVISASEDEESVNPFPGKDKKPFQRKKFDSFDRKPNGDSFKRKTFDRNSNDSFKRKMFGGNSDEDSFKKKKFDKFDRNSNRDSFKRNSFETNFSPKPSFREKGFQKTQMNSKFENKNNSFKNNEKPKLDFKNKGFQNKSFGENVPSKPFKSKAQIRSKDNFKDNKPKASVNKNPVDDKPLHPSWEAKKKLKEAANSKFQGKRIVFD